MRIVKLKVLQINVDRTARNAPFYRQVMLFQYLQTHCGLEALDALRNVDIEIY
jgi:hypothetical protein